MCNPLVTMTSGAILRRINENLQRLNGEKTAIVTLLSGHDKNIINVLQLLDVYDLHFPDFGSALIFELLNQDESYYVKVNVISRVVISRAMIFR